MPIFIERQLIVCQFLSFQKIGGWLWIPWYSIHVSVRKKDIVSSVTALDVWTSADRSHFVVYSGSGGVLTASIVFATNEVVKTASLAVFDTHSIHGIRITADSEILVWGDKSIAVIKHLFVLESTEITSYNLYIEYLLSSLDDLVLDCACYDTSSLIIGYAHNFVDTISCRKDA